MNPVVISQSMYFPWVGMLEQMRLAAVYVRYDDVQFSKGSFTNRVQVKTREGVEWLTVPLRRETLGRTINEVEISNASDWRTRHRAILVDAYRSAPFFKEMLDLVDSVFAVDAKTVGDLAFQSMVTLAKYFDATFAPRILDSAHLGIPGKGTGRVLEVVKRVGCDTYITGHGARNYLDHEAFERAGIDVRYMAYQCIPYPQLHGAFTPFVSALDLVANCGPVGGGFIQSGTQQWREFVRER